MTFKYTYKLIKVLEFDVDIYDEQFALRLELLQCRSDSNCFCAHICTQDFTEFSPHFHRTKQLVSQIISPLMK